MEVEDVPLVGRKFTCIQSNGSAMSRIDRFLVTGYWFNVWPRSTIYVLERDIFNHYLLLLKDCYFNWGLKSFRALDC